MSKSKGEFLNELQQVALWLGACREDIHKYDISVELIYTGVTDKNLILNDVCIANPTGYMKMLARNFLNLRKIMDWENMPLGESIEAMHKLLTDMNRLGLIEDFMTEEDKKQED